MKKPEFERHGYSIWDMDMHTHACSTPLENFHPTDIPRYIDEYVDLYPQWISSTQNNTVTGLDTFANTVVTHGTSQAMDWWHYWCEWNDLTCKVFKGEYPYHKTIRDDACPFVEDSPLQPGDALLISLPFSGNGSEHPLMQQTLNYCDQHGIPVFVDCAWFGCCSGLTFDFNRECIQAVAFSTTKGLKTDAWRNGILFSKHRAGGPQELYEWRWLSSFNLAVGIHQMKQFSPDAMWNKYQTAYNLVCDKLKLEATNTIYIAMAQGEEYDRFWRDDTYCRVNVRNHVKFFAKKVLKI